MEFIDNINQCRIILECLTEKSLLFIDTETQGLNPFENELLLLQIYNTENTYIFDCRKLKSELETNEDLKAIVKNNQIMKIFHNAKFDLKFLMYQLDLKYWNNIYDTMIAESLIVNGKGLKLGLKQVLNRYLGIEINKEERNNFIGYNKDTFSNSMLEYAVKDVELLYPLWLNQRRELSKLELLRVANIEFQLCEVLASMELNGILVDKEKWIEMIRGYEYQRAKLEAEITQMFKDYGVYTNKNTQLGLFEEIETYKIDLNSNKELLENLKLLGLDLESTGEPVLKEIDHPVVNKILEFRKVDKIISSFGMNFIKLINNKTNRIHTQYAQNIAESGRIISSKPNIQQIPHTEEFRSKFIPEKGYKFVCSDYSQCELRILAELSHDYEMVNAYKNDLDLHKATASLMYNIPIEKVTKDKRADAKGINFGLAYGMGAGSLSHRINRSYDKTKELIRSYFNAYLGVKKWIDRQKINAADSGYVKTMLGRIRFFDLPTQDDEDYKKIIGEIHRKGVNTPIQGTNADITKIALVKLYRRLKDYNAKIVNCIHDEVTIEVIDEQAKEVRDIVEEEMIKAGEVLLKTVPIKVDCKITDFWEH
jgi:DNA polymerase I